MRASIDKPLPLLVVLGQDGRLPPSIIIEGDSYEVFEHNSDGIDFFESLEGMLLEVHDATLAELSNKFKAFVMISDDGANASIPAQSGGVGISEDNLEGRFVLDLFINPIE